MAQDEFALSDKYYPPPAEFYHGPENSPKFKIYMEELTRALKFAMAKEDFCTFSRGYI